MLIRVDEIPESGRFLHFHWDEEHLGRFIPPEDPFELSLARPLNVDLEIQKGKDHIHISGSLEGDLRVMCHRCLSPFVFPLSEGVDVFLLQQEQAPEEEEAELEVEEMDYEFFDGVVIDVDRLVAEQVFLALPFKILCSESCKGLCPQCGANLNEEPCTCDASGKNRPFAGLAKLKSNSADAE